MSALAQDRRWLVEEEAKALFTIDAGGALRQVNDGSGDRAPRCFIGFTPDWSRCWFRYDVPADLAAALGELIEADPSSGWTEVVDRAGGLLDGGDGDAARFVGPAFCAERPVAAGFPEGVAGRLAGPGDSAAIEREISGVAGHLEAKGPVVIAWQGPRVVGACFSARRTSTVCEAGVEVIADARGQGIGPALVTQWASMTAGSGLVPLYSTEWDNAASLAVARRLALPQFAVIASLY